MVVAMRPHRWSGIDHLLTLTDDVGVLQHATLDVPNRSCGYCTDDVGRALAVACDAAAQPGLEEAAARLIGIYLAYLHDAQLPDGWFHGFMGYDRRWQDARGTPDAVGRAIWGLGYAERHAPRPTWRALAGRLRQNAMPIVTDLGYVRSNAYAVLGLVHAAQAGAKDEPAVRAAVDALAGSIAVAFEAHASADWRWCEDVMTYDNGRLPEALLRAGDVLGDERYVTTGLAMLDFLASATIEGGVFSPVGSAGWYPRGGVKARFGQQPLEAAAMVDAALAAYALTRESRWRAAAEIAHAWYLGHNALGAELARDGGCCDGLDAGGINGNMGAESTICYLMSTHALATRTEPIPSLRLVQ
jgi:hypothetical protein